LNGPTIIEASSFVTSPTAGLYLAQMGAEAIRVDQVKAADSEDMLAKFLHLSSATIRDLIDPGIVGTPQDIEAA
jgi:crotonobetainyl-CoA:carnitine CoA-transferase CaiB-like acyl-CoA transferase